MPNTSFQPAEFLKEIKKQETAIPEISNLVSTIKKHGKTPESDYLFKIINDYFSIDMNDPSYDLHEIGKSFIEHGTKQTGILLNSTFKQYYENISLNNLYNQKIFNINALTSKTKEQIRIKKLMENHTDMIKMTMPNIHNNLNLYVIKLSILTGYNSETIINKYNNKEYNKTYNGRTINNGDDLNNIQIESHQSEIEKHRLINQATFNLTKLNLAYLACITNIFPEGEIKDEIINNTLIEIGGLIKTIKQSIKIELSSIDDYITNQSKLMDEQNNVHQENTKQPTIN